MKHDADTPVVVCSPHFDDAVLSCWTVLARAPASEVANVFAGMPPAGYATWWDQKCGASSSVEMMQTRVEEDRAALALAEHEPHNLTLLDGQYRVRASGALHASMRHLPPLRWHALRVPVLRNWLQPHAAPSSEQIIAELTAELPAASVVCAPAAIGGHPDHVLVRDAALTLQRHGIPVRLYADLPYCLRDGWPGFVTGGSTHLDGAIERHWDRALRSVPQLRGRARDATIVTLTQEERAAKRAATARYLTQYGALNAGSAGPFNADSAGLLDDLGSFAHELYWELPA